MVPGDHVLSYPQQQGVLDALGERRLLVVVGPLVREAAGLMGMRGLVEAALAEPEFGEEENDIRPLPMAGRFADRTPPRFANIYRDLQPILYRDNAEAEVA